MRTMIVSVALGGAVVLTAMAMIGPLGVGCAALPSTTGPAVQTSGYRSPFDVAFGGEGVLAVTDRTAGELVLIDPAGAKVARRVAMNGNPTGLAWSADRKRVYVSEFGAASVAEVDAQAGKVIRRFAVGPYPMGLATAPKRGLLLVAEYGNDRLCAIDLATGAVKATAPLTRQPQFLAVTPDESLAVVSNLLPAGDAMANNQAACVSLVDLQHFTAKAVPLPPGATGARAVKVSPDGRWAYVVHTLGKYMLPTTQLDRGWINTNALSIVDLKASSLYCTTLLDLLSEGAADPWGLALSKDGATLWVTLAGAQQIARIDLGRLHPLLEGKVPKAVAGKYASPADEQFATRLQMIEAYRNSGVQSTWLDIAADPSKRSLLANDLTALHVADVLTRKNLDGPMGPRGVDVTADGSRLAVGAYFSGEVVLLDGATLARMGVVPLGPQPPIDEARRGEILFHDGTCSFQHWLSCATCHPSARSDGLDWDLLNDGIGNPKNSKSLLLAHLTPPMMAHGVRADLAAATSAGFKFILFRQAPDSDVQAVQAYLRSLTPLPSPCLVNGHLNPKAQRGKELFESPATGCARCHTGKLLTDLKMYDVGTRDPNDTSGMFVTPMLVEMWRSGPYLHDGSAATMRDVLTTRNQGDRHGATSKLTGQQVDDLVEFLLSQ